MKESITEVVTGAAVIVAGAAFFVWGASVTDSGPRGDQIDLTASFRSVEGVNPGTEVRMAGVRIGTVKGIALNPDTFRAETRMSIDRTVAIPDDSSAIIASEGLLGGSYVEISPGGSFETLHDGAEIVDTQGAVSLLQLLLTYVGNGEPQP